MHTFISGGCKNGKSFAAQRIASLGGAPLYYVATMISTGAEDDARIARHIADRAGWGFETIECGKSILNALEHADPEGAFLLDSVTALLANEMFSPSGFDPDAGARVTAELMEFVRRTRYAVLVSDFIYSDARLFDEWTQNYRRSLAGVDAALARVCDNVLEAASGCLICYKGVNPLCEIS